MLNFCQDLHESNNLSAYINVEGFPELTVLNCIGILTLFRPFQRTSKYATLTSLARDGFPGATGHVGPDGDKPTWVRGSCASTHTSLAEQCGPPHGKLRSQLVFERKSICILMYE